mmetsp:Transcript_10077/g.12573  ORF Transcript_10077/g.12573 Transcript_10077/m.12573 type:complete len:192 (+) Transcript_10077:310-885(+)
MEANIGGSIDTGLNSLTLNEPIRETILRDLRGIAIKLKFVLLPRVSSEDTLRELRNWDLWGPLILCMVLAVTLAQGALEGESGDTFSVVFALVWAGSSIVTLNAKLLNGKISFFQSLCVLGYCLFPLVLGALVCLAIPPFLARCLVIALCFAWSTRSSALFMSEVVKEERQVLAVYPVLLFYLAISWLILS